MLGIKVINDETGAATGLLRGLFMLNYVLYAGMYVYFTLPLCVPYTVYCLAFNVTKVNCVWITFK